VGHSALDLRGGRAYNQGVIPYIDGAANSLVNALSRECREADGSRCRRASLSLLTVYLALALALSLSCAAPVSTMAAAVAHHSGWPIEDSDRVDEVAKCSPVRHQERRVRHDGAKLLSGAPSRPQTQRTEWQLSATARERRQFANDLGAPLRL
jgi:hypothetical protein